jgi:hypothetical protein
MSIVGPSAAEVLAYQGLQQINSYVVQLLVELLQRGS